MEYLERLLTFLGTNEIALGLCSLLGIIGFIITILTWIRTKKISSILKYNSVTSQYNKERQSFEKAFEGHRVSIVEDGNNSDKILKDILKNVEAYDAKFHALLSLREKVSLWFFKRILKKSAKDADFNVVCNYLAALSGRLSKKEEVKNG